MPLQILLILAISTSFATSASDSLNVTLLYRQFCPHSKTFILKEFVPTYKVLGDDVLNINIVLTSQSTYVDGKLSPTCPGGEDECTCETYSSCILAKNYTQSQKIQYIECLASVKNKVMKANLKKCVEKANIPWDDVEKCYKSGDGFEALKKFNIIQHSYDQPITHVPFLVFNGVVDYEIDEDARRDFRLTVCDHLNYEPSRCTYSRNDTVKH